MFFQKQHYGIQKCFSGYPYYRHLKYVRFVYTAVGWGDFPVFCGGVPMNKNAHSVWCEPTT